MQLYAEEAVGKQISYMQQILNTQNDIKSGSVWKRHDNVILNAMKNSDRWHNGEKDGMQAEDIKKSFYVKTPMKVFAWNQKRRIDTVMTPYDSIKYTKQMLQAGFMAMDPLTGEVKAWVGGIDFRTYKFDHVNINTKRQVGSTIKPLLYSMAIDEGGFTPGTPVEDVQQNFTGYGNVPATTRSCSGETIPMSEALAFSKNCATAYIMKQMGDGNESAKKFVAFLQKCGVTTKVEPYPSIALGSGEISLIEMIQAYSMFAGHGLTTSPLYIVRIEDKNGTIIENFRPVRKQDISDLTASSMIDMMEGVLNYGTGKRRWSYNVTGEIAGKTGTTNDNSDAWFIGYSPQLVCGAWTGCDDRFIHFNSTTIGQGSSVALPIWGYFYSKVLADHTLNINNSIGFSKTYSSGGSSVVTDWMKQIADTSNNVEGGEMGDSTGIKTVPKNITPQDIKPESDTTNVDDDVIPPATQAPKSQAPEHQQPKAVMPEKKAGKGFLFGIFNKKKKQTG
jgi:penicillin-binding protein 1A